ncbi:MAG: LysR family transcriptional regulator [Verrucomicrobia bacterium]|nr:LysR family transcriptional regulator [Verrucomicrobiota bacterium]
MELRHLRYFVAVAEAENVSRAALTLHVSQPGLSRQIRDLEEELGFLLLERSAKSVRLTDAGRVFLIESRAVLERADEAVKAARFIASGHCGELHIGYAPTLAARILPPALRAFQTGMPSVRVKLHDLSTEEMLAGLHEGRLQLAFLERPRTAVLRGLRFEELMRDPLRLAVAPHHPLARRRGVALADAVREPFIAYSPKDYPDYHELLAGVFSATKGRLRIVEEPDGVSSLISAVGAGHGVALMPDSLACIAGARVKLLPLTPAPKPLSIGIVSPQTGRTTAAESFLKCAKEVLSGK